MKIKYTILFSESAKKELKRIDRYQARIILSWIEKNLDGCENPRAHGKPLVGDKSRYWRYRVGEYRILAEIDDERIIISVISIGHRKDIYK